MRGEQVKKLVESGGFELIETHISWVLLGSEHVYKIKKPVRFSFLDFSSVEKRKFFCEEEVRLNRRLAEKVYLGVVKVTGRGGSVELEGKGKAIDHAVKMKRLRRERMMDRMLMRGAVGGEDVKRLANVVSDFHRKAEPVSSGGYNSPQMIGAQIADLGNFRNAIESACGLGAEVDSILERSEGFIAKNKALLEERVKDGKVKDCHGDLHSGNVFFEDGVLIVDCIEFSRDFRCIDVASDAAFMAMDLDAFGREDLSKIFMEEYLAQSRDIGLGTLLDFYKCYRANVRAKIAAIGWLQKKSPEAADRMKKYIALAERYARGW
jgi:aminoglycoside phosphotransferase family enzyme